MRSYHFLTVAYKRLWCFFLETYQREKVAEKRALRQEEDGVEGTGSSMAGEVSLTPLDMKKYMLPWPRAKAAGHETINLWVIYPVDFYPPSLVFLVGRSGPYWHAGSTVGAEYRMPTAAFVWSRKE